jgi:hypothetical protein
MSEITPTKPKVAVLIASSYGSPFEQLRREIQPSVWEEVEKNEVDVFYVLGKKPNLWQQLLDHISCKSRYSKNFWVVQRLMDRFSLAPKNRNLPFLHCYGKDLFVDFPEGHRYMGVKIIAAYRFLLQQGYDIVYKTTLSTVVIQRNFLKTISEIPLDVPYYGGTKLSFINPDFVSGANLFLNRQALELLFTNIRNWHHWDLDDVAMGKIFRDKVSISELNSINISTFAGANELDYSQLGGAIHIRCKSIETQRNDFEIMSAVLRKLEESRQLPRE